jgi:hypothetical protein
MITIGNPVSIKYSLENNFSFSEVLIRPTTEYQDILALIQPHIMGIKRANVCLSGGVDSQFMIRLCEYFNIPFEVTTYLMMWDQSPINTDDYLHAQLLCKNKNVTLNTVEIDLKTFFNKNLHYQYGKKYFTGSPQIALHLHFLDLIKRNDTTIMLGGETPYMNKNSVKSQGPGDIAGLDVNFMMGGTFSYHRYAAANNVNLIKDILLYSPELIYSVLKLNIKIVETHKMHLETFPNTHLSDPLPVKYQIYESILPGGVYPLFKLSGFERIKKHFAVTSGVFDQFNKLYREPLQQQLRTQLVYTSDKHGTVRYKTGGCDKSLTTEFRSAIDTHNSKPANLYTFDF